MECRRFSICWVRWLIQGVKRQLIGVANPLVAERMLASLRLHGATSSWVVHGGGLDELTTTGPSTVLELRDGHVRTFTVDPVALGLAPAISTELTGGTPRLMLTLCGA